MIERGLEVPVQRQAELFGLSRSSVYYTPRPVSERDLRLMRRLDELHLELPFYGSRKLADALRREGHAVGKVLAFRLSNTLTTDFCVEALEKALAKFGRLAIFNTDQGSQFTSDAWTKTLKDAGVAISMDGQGRWIDNVFIERLWRSVKYEEVYLHAYTNGTEVRTALTWYFGFHNTRRSHQALGYRTPDELYFDGPAAATPIAA